MSGIPYSIMNGSKANGRRPAQRGRRAPRAQRSAVTSAPAAFDRAFRATDVRFDYIPAGVRVTHSESAKTFTDNGVTTALEVHPRRLTFLKGLANHFQNFRIIKWQARWTPSAGTGDKVRVIMAPWYESEAPVKSGLMAGEATVFLSTLPGATEFAGWAEKSAGWLARRAVRTTFKLFGLRGATTQPNADDEARIPGHVLVNVSSSAGNIGRVGRIWIDYTVELLSPNASRGSGMAIFSDSTSSAALALQSGTRMGQLYDYKFGNNTIQILSPGPYTFILQHAGTDPVLDPDGHTIKDIHNNVVTDRWLDLYDVGAGTITAQTAPDNYALAVNSATRSIQVFSALLDYGDQVTFDALTSGDLTSTKIIVLPEAPTMIPIA